MANKKVKLGGKPKNFKKTVEIVLENGEPADIEISFIYRTRKEYAALLDEKIAAAKAESAAAEAARKAAADAAGEGVEPEDQTKSVVDLFDEVDKAAAQFVLKIANGWDLDDPFTEASLLQLEGENPGSLQAITIAYARVVAEARVKN